MAHAEATAVVNRPAAVVFDFVLDGANNPRWRSAVTDIERAPNSPSGEGAVFKQGLKGPGGRRIDGDYQIVECRPNELLVFQVISGPARPTGTFRLRDLGDTTEVHFSLHYEPHGLAKLIDPLIGRAMQSEVAALANLKACLEHQ